MYDGKPALYTTAGLEYPRCEWSGTGTIYHTIWIYENGGYALKEIWVEGAYRTDKQDGIEGAVIVEVTPVER